MRFQLVIGKGFCRSIWPGIRAVLIAAIVGLSSVLPVPADAKDKDTLSLLLWTAPTTLNPHLTSGDKDWIASRISYEPLASFDRDGKLIPFLAAEIPSLENGGVAQDGKSVTWKLQQGLKWSDGEPVSARDVVFTYRFIINPEVGSPSTPAYKSVEKVEAVDDLTVKVVFKDVNPAWAQPFVGIQGMIIPEHVFAPYNNANAASAPANLAPVGTGPYIAKEFRTEDVLMIGEDVVNTVKIIYEPNPYYRDLAKLQFKHVTLQGGGDATVAAKAVLSQGVVDYAWNLLVEDSILKELESKGAGKVVLSFGPNVSRIMINFTDPNKETADGERSSTQFPHPFLADKRVRQAIDLAVDREKIASLYGRTGRATANILVSPSIYNSSNTTYKLDVAKAASLLDEAGWADSDGDGIRDKDGVALSLLFKTSVNPVSQQTQDIITQNLASIGIRVEDKMIDASIFFGGDKDNTKTLEHFYSDLEMYNEGNLSPDPGAYMREWICAEAAQQANRWSGLNASRYCNPAFDALYEKSTTEIDPAKRAQLFIQMNNLLIDDYAVIALVNRGDVSGLSTDIAGFDRTPWDEDTWNIADWRRSQ
jgi:peptide/nickel transport system substrate-binding protein